MTVTELWKEKLLPLLLPMPCLSCDRQVTGGRHFVGLCVRCRGRLRLLTGERCGGCGRRLHGAHLPTGYRCGRCRRRPQSHDRLIALWVFRPPMDSVIHGLKYQRLEYLGRHLARELAALVLAELPTPDLVTWVPMHWRRRLGRGYNQAERIGRPLAKALAIPARGALARTRATPPQISLERGERVANVSGAMRIRRRARVADRRVLLVDDVITTGATMHAAAAALREAGALEITALAAARTPGSDEPRARKVVIW